MKKSIKFIACLFAVSALAVACNNAPETTEDTTAVDTPEVIDTPVVDTPAIDTVAPVEEPVVAKKPAKKQNKVQQRTDVSKKAEAGRDITGLKKVDVAKQGSNALQDDNLKNSDSKGAVKTRTGF